MEAETAHVAVGTVADRPVRGDRPERVSGIFDDDSGSDAKFGEIDGKTGETRLNRLLLVVEKVENEATEISLVEANRRNPAAARPVPAAPQVRRAEQQVRRPIPAPSLKTRVRRPTPRVPTAKWSRDPRRRALCQW